MKHFFGIHIKHIHTFPELPSNNTHIFRELLANNTAHLSRVYIKQYWHFRRVPFKLNYCKIFSQISLFTMPPFLDVTCQLFFACTARLWNSLPIKCFPLTNYLNDFKSKIKRCLLTVGFFLRDFLYALIFLCFFFL